MIYYRKKIDRIDSLKEDLKGTFTEVILSVDLIIPSEYKRGNPTYGKYDLNKGECDNFKELFKQFINQIKVDQLEILKELKIKFENL